MLFISEYFSAKDMQRSTCTAVPVSYATTTLVFCHSRRTNAGRKYVYMFICGRKCTVNVGRNRMTPIY